VLRRELATRRLGADRNIVEQTERVDGILVGPDGEAIADAWLLLPDIGKWADSEGDGRFSFNGVPDGSHRCRVRGADGSEGETEFQIPRDSRELRVSMRPGSLRR
jgi:hypothetical protein